MNALALATEAYQAQLETMRRVDAGSIDLDYEEHEQAQEDLDKAQRAMEVAWLDAKLSA